MGIMEFFSVGEVDICKIYILVNFYIQLDYIIKGYICKSNLKIIFKFWNFLNIRRSYFQSYFLDES